MYFPGGSDGKASACSAGDPASIPGLGRSPGEGKGCPLQYSGLENFMDCIIYSIKVKKKRSYILLKKIVPKWALGSITMNKASGDDGIPAELFQILKGDAVKVLHSVC